jgi:glycosyltransferase involved in cell wall biosynthesis
VLRCCSPDATGSPGKVTGRVAVVLPPKEGFSPDAVGAIGLLVHRLCRAAGGEVVGRPVTNPFTDVPFHPAAPGWGFSATSRYIAGVARVLATLRPALVEVHNRPEIALHLARRFPRVVLFLHNDPHGMRGARTTAERAALLRRLSRVVTVSDHLRHRFLEGVDGDVMVLPNCIDVPERVHKVRDRLILFVGRVVADKGADAFVEACAAVLPQLPGWRAEMVGADRFARDSPMTSFIERVQERAASVGVAMPGYMSHTAAMERMSRAAIAVVPSRWPEPFGLTALEAMAHGAALVCSRRGALPEVAGNGALYADPDAAGALPAAILSLAMDADRRTELVKLARARAAGFDTVAAAARLRSLREAVGG